MLYILTPSPTPGHDPGATQHRVEGLGLGKQHIKFQLPSVKDTHPSYDQIRIPNFNFLA